MAKSLSVASVIEKNRLSSDVPFLMLLEVSVIDPNTGSQVETIRVVRNTEAIVFQGNQYEPASFDIELKQEAGTMQTVNLSFRDYTKAVQARMQAYGGGVGFAVKIMVVDAGNLAQPAEVVEYFDIIGASAANYEVQFELGTENALTKSFPRRRQARDFCQWRYKSGECGYTGALPTCDRSLQGPNGCAAHNNTIRFGAFPGINSRDVRYG